MKPSSRKVHTNPSPHPQLFLAPEILSRTLALQYLVVSEEALAEDEATMEEMGLVSGMEVSLMLEVDGGAKGDSRYKKSTSRFRWKWAKKRTRRLQRKRRKMRMRAR